MSRGRPAGQTPYGYKVRYNERTGKTAGWEIVEEHAAVVREIIRRVGRAEPLHEIRRYLSQGSVPAPSGGAWGTTSIRHIAKNPSYAGLVALPDGSYAARQPQEDGAEWPPLVKREEWEAAAAVLSSRMVGPREGKVTHLLGGLCRCECGEVINSRGYKGYACVTGHMCVRYEWLDGIVEETICEWLSYPDVRDLFTVDDEPEKARARSEVKELRERRAKFRSMAAKGQIEPDALADIEAQIGPQITAAEQKLNTVTVVPALAELLGDEGIQAAGDDMEKARIAVRAAWKPLTVQARRTAITAITGITVKRVSKHETKAVREDVGRVAFDWKPQAPRKGPGGRPRPAG